MKILHLVEFYYPSVGGAQEVVRHLSERMVRAGHDVTVATTKLPSRTSSEHNGVKIIEFDISGNEVNGIRGEREAYTSFLLQGKFDVIMSYAAQQWTADLLFTVLGRIKAKTVFVPCGYSALHDPAYADYFNRLPDILRKFDATIYLSDNYQDINFARQHKINNVHLIPNGADEAEYTQPLQPEEKTLIQNRFGLGGFVIMHVGNYTGEKGHRELLKMFRMLPVPKATLVTAGVFRRHDGCFDEFEAGAHGVNMSKKLLGKRVVMLDGADRRTVVEAMKAADLFVFPSNIECSPLVLYETAAAGVPFVATTAGNSLEIAKWTGGGIIVKSHPQPNGRVKADLADLLWQTTRLAYHHKLRQSFGSMGHKNWLEKYTWEKLTNRYLDLYKTMLKDK